LGSSGLPRGRGGETASGGRQRREIIKNSLRTLNQAIRLRCYRKGHSAGLKTQSRTSFGRGKKGCSEPALGGVGVRERVMEGGGNRGGQNGKVRATVVREKVHVLS